MEHDQIPTDSSTSSRDNLSPSDSNPQARAFISAREIRQARRKEKRNSHQIERTRIREKLHHGLRDPEVFLDLEAHAKNKRKLQAGTAKARRLLLDMQRRKLKSELANTRDLDTFILKTSRSRTLYALIGMGFFRHVLHSEEFREDHRYKLAILRALEDPGLAKSIHQKWKAFDREFPDPALTHSW